MIATVYTTAGGRRFHADYACRALLAGRELNDWDIADDAPLSGWAMPVTHLR